MPDDDFYRPSEPIYNVDYEYLNSQTSNSTDLNSLKKTSKKCFQYKDINDLDVTILALQNGLKEVNFSQVNRKA